MYKYNSYPFIRVPRPRPTVVAWPTENGVLALPARGFSCVRAESKAGPATLYHTSSVIINSVSTCVYLFNHLTHYHNLHGAVYGNEYTCLTPVTPVIASNSRNFQPADPSSPARFTASPARLISLNALLPVRRCVCYPVFPPCFTCRQHVPG